MSKETDLFISQYLGPEHISGSPDPLQNPPDPGQLLHETTTPAGPYFRPLRIPLIPIEWGLSKVGDALSRGLERLEQGPAEPKFDADYHAKVKRLKRDYGMSDQKAHRVATGEQKVSLE